MRWCGNCEWSFSPEDEDELRREYHGEDYDLDANTPKAGDCSIGCIHNDNFYCASHTYNEYSVDYQDYLGLDISDYISIDLYNLIRLSWSEDTSNCELLWPISIGQCEVTSLLIKELLGGKIMKCLSVRGNHYYNLIDNKIIDLTSDQYDLGEEPLYCDSIEESPVLDEELLERYRLFLTNFKNNLNEYSYEMIAKDERIQRHKAFLNKLCTYTTFEIDEYYVKDNIEYIQFDFVAQNTGNIFKYSHNLDTNEYFMEDQLVFTYFGTEEIPLEIVKSAFEVARDNMENIKLLNKIKRINSH